MNSMSRPFTRALSLGVVCLFAAAPAWCIGDKQHVVTHPVSGAMTLADPLAQSTAMRSPWNASPAASLRCAR